MNPFITHLNAPAEVRMSSNLSSHPNFNRSAYPFLLGLGWSCGQYKRFSNRAEY